jgi:hypothetical protein
MLTQSVVGVISTVAAIMPPTATLLTETDWKSTCVVQQQRRSVAPLTRATLRRSSEGIKQKMTRTRSTLTLQAEVIIVSIDYESCLFNELLNCDKQGNKQANKHMR